MEVSTQNKIPSKDQPKIDQGRDAPRTRTLLCVPIYNRARLRGGAIQLLNKKEGPRPPSGEGLRQTFWFRSFSGEPSMPLSPNGSRPLPGKDLCMFPLQETGRLSDLWGEHLLCILSDIWEEVS